MMGGPLHIDWRRRRVWILGQRIHHGPWALVSGPALLGWGLWAHHTSSTALGGALLAWGLQDLHDVSVWFVRGAQI